MKLFLRILLGLLGFLLLLYLAFLFIGTPLIKSSIEKKLAYYPGDSLAIGSLRLQFFPLGLKAGNARFSFHQPGDSLMQQFSGELSEIEVEGIDWWRAWRHNTWEVSWLEIGEGKLRWEVTNVASADSARKDKKSSSKKANLLVENFDIDRLELELNRDSTRVHLQVSLRADSLGFNRSDSLRWGYSRVVLHSEDASYKQGGGNYDLAYHSLDFDSRHKKLRIKNLSVKPRLKTAEWNKKYHIRKSLIQQLEIPLIEVSGLELGRLPQGLYARKITADSVSTRLYSNHRNPREQKRKPLPSEMIATIPFPVNIDTLAVTHASLLFRYTTKVEETGLARLEGDQISLKVYPLSNIGHSTSADVNIDFSIRFMQQATLKLQARCFADSPDHHFEVDARLSPTPFKAFNPLVYPSLELKFKSGYCEELQAHFKGNDYRCDGKMDIAYHDLELEFPEDRQEGLNLFGQVKEIGANLVMVNSNNDMGDHGQISYERPPNLPFIGYWWRGLQSGLKDAILRFK